MPDPHRSHLPPEIRDHIVDLLNHSPETLKQCCLVSKSWVPRARKHLFATVYFATKGNVEGWKKTFPDSARSPARYTRNLRVHCVSAITTEDAREGGWLRSFSHVVRLELFYINGMFSSQNAISLAPFHKISPSVRSLHVTGYLLLPLQIFRLVQSLPLLENVKTYGHHADGWCLLPVFPTSPIFTGTLELELVRGIFPLALGLLDMPNGLHFRKLILSCHESEDFSSVGRLVAACSDTLKCLEFKYCPPRQTSLGAIDLSKATKLVHAVFRVVRMNIGWVTQTLRTITPKHRDLLEISIDMHREGYHFSSVGQVVREEFHEQWLELDWLLVQLWELHSIRLRLMHEVVAEDERDDCYGFLLPEMTKRGILDLVEVAYDEDKVSVCH